MQLHLEKPENHSIESYSETGIKINSQIYQKSLMVSQHSIISEISINSIKEIDESFIEQLNKFCPEIVIIGHNESGAFPPALVLSQLSRQRIGLECMSIGAACRTYNVLLSELRSVVAVFIF